MTTITLFSKDLITWQKVHGRHDLPWQQNRTPYSVWLSEVMLQQTQVSKVKEYFDIFMQKWPTVHDMAKASEDAILHAWSGMGYYRRARNLYKAAQQMSAYLKNNQENWPEEPSWWESLSGVGKTTANAICAQSFGKKEPILDANARRVYQRYLNDGQLDDKKLWKHAYNLIAPLTSSKEDVIAYTQGLMDLGSNICGKTPACQQCPLSAHCQYDSTTFVAPLKATKEKKEETINWLLVVKENKVAVTNSDTNLSIWDKMYTLPYAGDTQGKCILSFEHILTHKKLTINVVLGTEDELNATNGAIKYISIHEINKLARPKPMDIIFTTAEFQAQCLGG